MVSFSRRITQFMSTQHSARATNTPKWTLFLTVILMDLLVGMEFDLFVPSFPDLQHTFGLSPAWTETLLSVNFLSYCGLIKLEEMSGGKSYGKRTPRFCRSMKAVFKTAALAAIDGDNEFGEYCKYLIEIKRYSDRNARHALARRIATITYGVMKGEIKYDAFKRRKKIEKNKKDTINI